MVRPKRRSRRDKTSSMGRRFRQPVMRISATTTLFHPRRPRPSHSRPLHACRSCEARTTLGQVPCSQAAAPTEPGSQVAAGDRTTVALARAGPIDLCCRSSHPSTACSRMTKRRRKCPAKPTMKAVALAGSVFRPERAYATWAKPMLAGDAAFTLIAPRPLGATRGVTPPRRHGLSRPAWMCLFRVR